MISMSALRDSFASLGFKDVASYINSGNILFKTKAADARKLELKIEGMLAADYKIPCKVVIRSAAEMAQLVKTLPKDWNDAKDWRYNVVFLRHTIDSKSIIDGLNATPEIEKVRYVPGTLLWSSKVQDLTEDRDGQDVDPEGLPGHDRPQPQYDEEAARVDAEDGGGVIGQACA